MALRGKTIVPKSGRQRNGKEQQDTTVRDNPAYRQILPYGFERGTLYRWFGLLRASATLAEFIRGGVHFWLR
jgi:hypothetical protein